MTPMTTDDMTWLHRVRDFVLNREAATALTFVTMTLAGVAEATDVLPDGPVKLWLLGSVAVANSLLVRARVWSQRSHDIAVVLARTQRAADGG